MRHNLTMKAQEILLQHIEEIKQRLALLRAQVQSLPEVTDSEIHTRIPEAVDSNGIDDIFETLQALWQVDPDVAAKMSLEEMQAVMAQGMPVGWASQEIQRIREE